MKRSEREKAEAREQLLKWLKPGDTVYTILDHVSRSGMQRHIRILVPYTRDDDGHKGEVDFIHPNYSAAKLLGVRQARGDGLVMDGCGMDMGFHLVYLLGAYLWPEGFGCIGERCPSNDHSNSDRDRTPHGTIDEAGPMHPCYCHTDPWPEDKQSCSACGCARIVHWHRDGGYALRHRWL